METRRAPSLRNIMSKVPYHIKIGASFDFRENSHGIFTVGSNSSDLSSGLIFSANDTNLGNLEIIVKS